MNSFKKMIEFRKSFLLKEFVVYSVEGGGLKTKTRLKISRSKINTQCANRKIMLCSHCPGRIDDKCLFNQEGLLARLGRFWKKYEVKDE